MALGKHFPRVRLGTDLVAYYNLNVGFYTTGKVFDYSRKGHTGTVAGTSCLPKYPGFNFDGSKDYIDTDDSFQSTFQSDFSISVWIKPDDGQPSHTEYVYGVDGFDINNRVYLGYTSQGQLTAGYSANTNGINKITVSLFQNGQEDWHHIVVIVKSLNGVTLYIYLDGTYITSGNHPSAVIGDYTSSQNLLIGNVATTGRDDNFFDGLIGEVMIYEKELTATEIKGLYRQTKRFYTKE
ncbi:unnamed protein product [marine sediment metagenome]|uniref:LamG-like jellyroll fold domain-containing protein n=1 Tax=marine sediment metagenome TaxID=412755 RepID=X0T3B6_9ZZZZ